MYIHVFSFSSFLYMDVALDTNSIGVQTQINQSSNQELIPFHGDRLVIISPCEGAIGKYVDASPPMGFLGLALAALSPVEIVFA